MRISDVLYESIGRTLYHGTLRKYTSSIQKIGIMPSIGEFTKEAYGIGNPEDFDNDAYEEGEPNPHDFTHLVFAADKHGLYKCYSAIGSWIRIEYPNESYPYSLSTISRYGALCIIREGESFFDYRYEDEDPPEKARQVEPEDYYIDRYVKVDHILYGKKLAQFLSKYLAISGNTSPKDTRQMWIKNYVKQNPNADRKNIHNIFPKLTESTGM